MSYNLWFGGTKVNDYHNKQVRFLTDSGVDIVGVQESSGGHAKRLGEALGWDYWQGDDVGIISRYPIVEKYPASGVGGSVRIALDQDLEINVWNVHLGYDPYGPYDFCFSNMTREQVLNRESISGRTEQIKQIIKEMEPQLANADRIPVILTGDFNAPSHLDWTNFTRSLHCDVGSFDWPTSKYPIAAGMTDSFREVHRNPRTEPGITWSPIYLTNELRPEPKDRIDFIYKKGKHLRAYKSETVVAGKPRPEPNHQDNEWTSDHAAVNTIFKLRMS
ncbi:hypothetical protein QQS21_004099 [Conoideocrella luteorostrata]|uniref:Endonuclease/exonuclease/phosphatase domain-containing protein n=1 Tax=Conoideocrella luteorostrata TaxID=1105319 RepID=A0AAJ0CS25_9HYPO|nr:hypothetical protein QQS21_004099 [Conoideocrella luteorostrata]